MAPPPLVFKGGGAILTFGGKARYIQIYKTICLMENQTRRVYKKVETEKIVNVDRIKQDNVHICKCCVV